MNTGQFMNKLNKCHENSSFVVKNSQNAKYKQCEIPIDISVAIASFYSEYDPLHNRAGGIPKFFEYRP